MRMSINFKHYNKTSYIDTYMNISTLYSYNSLQYNNVPYDKIYWQNRYLVIAKIKHLVKMQPCNKVVTISFPEQGCVLQVCNITSLIFLYECSNHVDHLVATIISHLKVVVVSNWYNMVLNLLLCVV